MSGLTCSRMGCECMFCEYYSSIHGYICAKCLEELVDSDTSLEHEDVKKFMRIPRSYPMDMYAERRDVATKIFSKIVRKK